MTINVNTAVPLRGDITLIRRDAATGKILNVWEKRNVITYGATDSLVRLLAPNVAFGATVQEENQLKSIRWGTANTAANRSDVDLFAEGISGGNPVRTELLDADRIVGASGTVEFVSFLDAGTGNGNTYREIGLFTRGTLDDPQLTVGATLFARQTIPDQAKNAAVTLEARWVLTFTV